MLSSFALAKATFDAMTCSTVHSRATGSIAR